MAYYLPGLITVIIPSSVGFERVIVAGWTLSIEVCEPNPKLSPPSVAVRALSKPITFNYCEYIIKICLAIGLYVKISIPGIGKVAKE